MTIPAQIRCRHLFLYTFLALFLGTSVWYAVTRAETVSQLPPNAVRVDTFDAFAFSFPEPDAPMQEEVLPLPPWSAVDVPALIAEKLVEAETIILRPDPMGDQLWFTPTQIGGGDSIPIFDSASGTWRVVSGAAGDEMPPITLTHYSKSLDTVVGIGYDAGEGDLRRMRLLRLAFDRAEEQFQVDSAISLSPALGDALAETWTTLVEHRKSFLIFDDDDVLWLFLEGDGIYRLDFAARTVERRRSLGEIDWIHTVLHAGGGGRFFFSGFGATYQYDASTNSLGEIEIPFAEGRPTGAFVDSGGTLWSGDALWYRPPDGDVQTFHPRPRSYWWHQVWLDEWRYYTPPDPFMETSDGRIWFQIKPSSNWKVLRSGIAWFNPATGEGCWFTSETGPLQEDLAGNLWLLLDGILYTRSRP